VVSDPLPQALALTALVIGLATVALLLALVHRAIVVFRTAEQDELAETETEHQAGLERERQADREEVESEQDSEQEYEQEHGWRTEENGQVR
jgi:multicomponent Na+:H+ antiporter subunit C